jgi:hypothetical protein
MADTHCEYNLLRYEFLAVLELKREAFGSRGKVYELLVLKVRNKLLLK